jgi:hypothetical protein
MKAYIRNSNNVLMLLHILLIFDGANLAMQVYNKSCPFCQVFLKFNTARWNMIFGILLRGDL